MSTNEELAPTMSEYILDKLNRQLELHGDAREKFEDFDDDELVGFVRDAFDELGSLTGDEFAMYSEARSVLYARDFGFEGTDDAGQLIITDPDGKEVTGR